MPLRRPLYDAFLALRNGKDWEGMTSGQKRVVRQAMHAALLHHVRPEARITSGPACFTAAPRQAGSVWCIRLCTLHCSPRQARNAHRVRPCMLLCSPHQAGSAQRVKPVRVCGVRPKICGVCARVFASLCAACDRRCGPDQGPGHGACAHTHTQVDTGQADRRSRAWWAVPWCAD